MTRIMGVVFALAVGANAGCQSGPKTRAAESTDTDDLWPGAPTPVATNTPRVLRYQPANLHRYRILVDELSTGASRETFNVVADVDFRPGPTPVERNVHVETLELTGSSESSELTVRISYDEFYSKTRTHESRVRRGQRDLVDVVALTASPFAVATFDPVANTVRLRANPEYPIEKLMGEGDALDEGLVLLPDLPTEPIAPGHHWSVTRNVPIGNGGRDDTTFDFKYAGDSKCPSGSGTCALLSFQGTSAGKELVNKVRGVRRYTGKVYFDYERGTIDESRVRSVTELELSGHKASNEMNYKMQPRT